MNQYSGFLMVINEEQRADAVRDLIIESSRFTEALSDLDWFLGDRELFLISLDRGSIDYAALVTIDRRVASFKTRVRFTHFVEFRPPISFKEIDPDLLERIRPYFVNTASGRCKRVPLETWQSLMGTLKSLRPDSADSLLRLEEFLTMNPESFEAHEYQIIAQERDATNLALRASGFDHQLPLRSWRPKQEPFLEGLTEFKVAEDWMIVHDMRVFGDWKLLLPSVVGIARFEKRDETLTIANANRHSLENTFGFDLIYYNWTYESYIMVQYKRVREETSVSAYRPDSNYESELRRMQEWREELLWSVSSSS